MIPVNPRPGLEEIRGLKVYPYLASIGRSVDMVQVFRKSEELPNIAHQAIAIGAKVLWTQIGVVNHEAARIAEGAGLEVIMNRCPKIELNNVFWEPNLKMTA
jgi:predicted CoA-binding protein